MSLKNEYVCATILAASQLEEGLENLGVVAVHIPDTRVVHTNELLIGGELGKAKHKSGAVLKDWGV